MLEYEEKTKHSPDFQKYYTEVKDEVNGWIRITEELQQKVAYHFGYHDVLSNMLVVERMRRANLIYPDDEAFLKVSVYRRENRAKLLEIKIGTDMNDIFDKKDIQLFDIHKTEINFQEILDPTRYNLVIASSDT